AFQPGTDNDGESQMRTGRRIRSAEFEVELLPHIGAAEFYGRADTQRSFAVALAEPGVTGAPVMRLKPQIRDRAARRECNHRRQVTNDAGCKSASPRRYTALRLGIEGLGIAALVQEAEVNVGAVAHSGNRGFGREGGMPALKSRDLLGD